MIKLFKVLPGARSPRGRLGVGEGERVIAIWLQREHRLRGTKSHTLVSPGGGLRVSGTCCGRRGAPRGVSRIHLRPSGHHFFNFGGIAGRADRIFGSDGPSKT